MIPTRFSEHRFRLMESLLASVVSAHPKAVKTHAPRHISADSYANQVRDAAKSYLLYGWISNVLTYEPFKSIWAMVCVQVLDHDTIRIGSRGADTEDLPQPARNVGLQVHSTKPEIAKAILLLHHEGILTEPTLFVAFAVLTTLQEEISSKNLNVICDERSDSRGILVF